jgi:hypothetical protein
MVEYRRIQPAYAAQAAAFAIQGMRPDLYPMRLSREKIDGTIAHFMQSTSDFHLAAFEGERIVGGIAAVAHESPFFERCDATVVMCRATLPGVGRALVAAMKAWADDDIRIRRVMFPTEFDARPGMLRLLRGLGFSKVSAICAMEKP